MLNKILFKNANLITVSTQGSFKGHLFVEGDRIKHIIRCEDNTHEYSGASEVSDEAFLKKLENEALEVIDLQGDILMPGLINAHSHMSMEYFRNYADDLPLMQWLEEKIWPKEALLNDEYVSIGTKVAILECIRCGTTTFRDMYFYMDSVAKSTIESGIRGVLGRGIVGFGDPDRIKLKEAIALHQNYHGKGDGRVYVEIAPHAIYTNDDEYLKAAYEAAKELSTTFHIHLSESRQEVEDTLKKEGISPVEKLESLGLLSKITSGAHCVHLFEKDFELLRKYDVSVLYNPSSNLKLGNGFANVVKMLDMGINVALGTDGSSSNNNLNMLEELHIAAIINKGINHDPLVLPAIKAIEMATINGAKALGLEKEIGSLEIGKKADIIIIDTKKPHLTPLGNIESAVCYSVSGSDVRTVVVNGEFVMRDYQILTLDEQEILTQMNIKAKELLG